MNIGKGIRRTAMWLISLSDPSSSVLFRGGNEQNMPLWTAILTILIASVILSLLGVAVAIWLLKL